MQQLNGLVKLVARAVLGALCVLTLGTGAHASGSTDTALTTVDNSKPEILRVAVASNFYGALRALQSDFETRTGHRLQLSAGATGKHFAQIRQGAPFHAFLAADEERPRLLEAEGFTIAATRFTYAYGRLALWIPDIERLGENPGDGKQAVAALSRQLQTIPAARLAIANPRLAPYGAASEAWLRQNDFWTSLEAVMVRGENIGQAFHFVASGSVPMGLVAQSQLQAFEGVSRDNYWRIDPAAHPPIRQQAVLLKDTPGARAFMDWLRSAATGERIAALGYDLSHAEP